MLYEKKVNTKDGRTEDALEVIEERKVLFRFTYTVGFLAASISLFNNLL